VGLATNQKAAGSSPAERARESPANAGFSPLAINLKIGLYHPFDHLSLSKRLCGVFVVVCIRIARPLAEGLKLRSTTRFLRPWACSARS
jgi:hypothetical protein